MGGDLMSSGDERAEKRPNPADILHDELIDGAAGERADAIPSDALEAARRQVEDMQTWQAPPSSGALALAVLTAALPFLRAAHPEAGNEETERLYEAGDALADAVGDILADDRESVLHTWVRRWRETRAAQPEADRAPKPVSSGWATRSGDPNDEGESVGDPEADRAPEDKR